jgi:hypothetical protein
MTNMILKKTRQKYCFSAMPVLTDVPEKYKVYIKCLFAGDQCKGEYSNGQVCVYRFQVGLQVWNKIIRQSVSYYFNDLSVSTFLCSL